MPLFTVTMKAGRAADEKNVISRAIHEASVKAGYPDDDMISTNSGQVLIKLMVRLFTEMLEVRILPGQLPFHAESCEHFQETLPSRDEMSSARIAINLDQ
jgi:hypothetical protein